MNRYREISPFALAFAAEYKGFMKANGITNLQIAEHLGRNDGYVSERANGKRPLDTDDVDALAQLAGWSPRELIIELARRARIQAESNVTHADFGRPDVPSLKKDELPAVARPTDPEPTDEQ
ncbi:MAG: hypothetical protein QM630_01140 [Microbacterium sp.]